MPRYQVGIKNKGDHYHWRITPNDAVRYEHHNRRTEGGGHL